MRASRVVAAHPRLGGAAEPQGVAVLVRVGAGSRIHDRPVAHELELLVVPGGALGSLVRAVPHLDRLRLERRTCVGRVEQELDHLPVALVCVVEVVEGIEEPVLERQLPGKAVLADDVRVHDRFAASSQALRPAVVVAAGIERIAREVEVVLEALHQIVRGRRDLHEVGDVPRAAQRDGLLVEQKVDVGRDERLAVAADVLLLDEPDDRRVPLGERLFVREVGRRARRRDERSE